MGIADRMLTSDVTGDGEDDLIVIGLQSLSPPPPMPPRADFDQDGFIDLLWPQLSLSAPDMFRIGGVFGPTLSGSVEHGRQ